MFKPRNHNRKLHGELPHALCLSQSINKCSYRTLWGQRTNRERKGIARALIYDYGLPWKGRAQSQSRFARQFVLDESVVLGTWSASPWQVAGMLEQGFRGSTLRLDAMLLKWNDRSYALERVSDHSFGLTRAFAKALQAAVSATAPEAVVQSSDLILAAKTGSTDVDAWFAGFILTRDQMRQAVIHPRITFVAWAGYDDNRKATDIFGGKIFGPVFGRFLRDRRVQYVLRGLLQ